LAAISGYTLVVFARPDILNVRQYVSGIQQANALCSQKTLRKNKDNNIIHNSTYRWDLRKNSPSTFAQTCAFYAKIGEKNFGNRCKGLWGKEIIFLEFLEIAR
jgi:hypothetical protein